MTLQKNIILVLFLLFLSAGGFSQEKKVNLLFVGDVMQHDGQLAGAYNSKTKSYSYFDVFKFVKPIIEEADIAIANLEVTHAGKPYKGYPQFTAPPELSEAVVEAGFDVILTSNNHSCDGGKKGIIGTLDELDKLGVQHTGTFRSAAEREANYPLIVQKNGIKIAILNYTYGTNGLSVDLPLIVNYIDSSVMRTDFKKAKELKADFIICTMHWGTEYMSLPNTYQKKWEEFCYRQGADMVIGGHPHVLQPIEQKSIKQKEKLTVWSLGNFVSNQRARYKNGGMLVRANIEKHENETKLIENDFILTYVFPRKEGITTPFYILPAFNYDSLSPSFLSDKEREMMLEFLSDSRKLMLENGIKTKEYLIENSTVISEKVSRFLKPYYAVSFTGKLPHELGYELIHFTSIDGNNIQLTALNSSKEESLGHLNFLKDIGFADAKLVYINPTTLETKVINE